jgi:hypothetical protein
MKQKKSHNSITTIGTTPYIPTTKIHLPTTHLLKLPKKFIKKKAIQIPLSQT